MTDDSNEGASGGISTEEPGSAPQSLPQDVPVSLEAKPTISESSAEKPSDDTDPAPPEAPGADTTEETRPAVKIDSSTATDATDESAAEEKPEEEQDPNKPIVSKSKRTRPAYKYDPSKITLRFLFANRDGLTVTIGCDPSDTVGEVKGALLSVWPEDLPNCSGGDHVRLICMGKGYLMPDTRTLKDCEIPIFKTHPTPINVSIKPEVATVDDVRKKDKDGGSGLGRAANSPTSAAQASQGCFCSIL